MNVGETSKSLAATMAKQLRVRGGSLEDVAARAGRRLPRHLRTEVAAIIEAEALMKHPKFAHRVDVKRLKTAEKKLLQFLGKQNPAKERWAEILDRIAGITFLVFLVVLTAFLFLLWRGSLT